MIRTSIHPVTQHASRGRFRRLAGILALICFASQGEVYGHEKARCSRVDFEELVTKTGFYTGKRVCVTGVAGVDGISFTLSAPPRLRMRQLIVVDRHSNIPSFDHLNNRWVKVTGIVQVDREKLFACRMLLEDVEVLARRPVKGVRVYGMFFNEGPTTIRLDVINRAGNESDSMTLSPGDVLKTVVVEGTANVSHPSTSASPPQALSSCVVPTQSTAPDFFEKSTRTFYFRIADGRVELVKPQQASVAKARWREIEKKSRLEMR